MAVTVAVRVGLFALSGNVCAFPGCEQVLVVDGSVVGEVCHIRGQRPTAARYDADLAAHELDAPDNLIVLCSVHHKVIDDQADAYPVERLRAMKLEHERGASAVESTNELLQGIAALLQPKAVPDEWWERPGAPRFRTNLASARPRGGQAWSYDASIEQVVGSDIGQVRAGFYWELDGERELPEPQLEHDGKWRVAGIKFSPEVGGALQLRIEFWWDGRGRFVGWRWGDAPDFQTADVEEAYGDLY